MPLRNVAEGAQGRRDSGQSAAASSLEGDVVAIWEWCKLREKEFSSLADIKEDQWQPYSRQHCLAIEAAYSARQSNTCIQIADRSYQIEFDDRTRSKLGGMVQIRVKRNKVRQVRRRLASAAEARALTSSDFEVDTLAAEMAHMGMEGDAPRPLFPLWEWCMLDATRLKHRTADTEVPDHDWGVYSPENTKAIEDAYQQQQESVEVTVAMRKYKIIFAGGKHSQFGGMIQISEELQKVREVRRRLVDRIAMWYANAAAGDDSSDQCVLCHFEFAKTPELPCTSFACSHKFHSVCAQMMAENCMKGCPLCRRPVEWSELGTLSPPGVSNLPTNSESSDRFRLQQTPELGLLNASFNGRHAAVRELLAMRVDVNVRSPMNATPLISASLNGHMAVVEELLAARANANLLTDDQNTALFMATARSHLDICRLLLQNGADPAVRNRRGQSALGSPEVSAMYRELQVLQQPATPQRLESGSVRL
mmetsp:Transcript_33299/g.75902  ORF Transcript_33299/g.75902 Transcript_33299/m.75902 type:complete len:479 (-) Transcript_33299:330-1766(-)